MKNSNLVAAKRAKNDEFYTRREDIENELFHYKDHFAGKTVYCNCDDPDWSEFWKFFCRNFKPWGLKRLIATHYAPSGENFSYMIELTDGDKWNEEPLKIPIQSNGDFRSAVCIDFLKQADIVVTNPPFSLFREYMAQLMAYEKQFLIIGNMNAITYKEIFPLLRENRVWLGFSHPKQFLRPDGTVQTFGNILWFTNLDHMKRHEQLDLRGNRYQGNEAHYPRYDNYDAIDVSKVVEIPGDYDGVMGVPITFLDKYCPEQFEVCGITLGNTGDYPMTRLYENAVQHNKDGSVQGGGKVNTRAAILVPERPDGVYYTADGVNGYLLSVYARVLIRRK